MRPDWLGVLKQTKDNKDSYEQSKLGSKKPKEQRSLRLSINARERRKMHNLNDALGGLRSFATYAHSPSIRKRSKIATCLFGWEEKPRLFSWRSWSEESQPRSSSSASLRQGL